MVVEPSATTIFFSTDMLLLSRMSDAPHPYSLILTVKVSAFGRGKPQLDWRIKAQLYEGMLDNTACILLVLLTVCST